MSLAKIYTRTKSGLDAPEVCVEVHLSNGLPSFALVGLPETAVKESKDRVRSAIINAHFEFPARRITVNLAPADIPKEGSRFDLAIAIGILIASGQLQADGLERFEFLAELALSGELRPVTGVLPSAIACGTADRQLFIACENADEAALPGTADVLPAAHLLEVCAHLLGHNRISPHHTAAKEQQHRSGPDMAEVIGQHQARRALEIAAAGGHNLLFIGPPGSGKSMLASRIGTILPPMTREKALESAALHSLAGKGLRDNLFERPYRAPHHTASAVALVGGGSSPKPGEISLAHNGVLFLDELPEFPRKVLEVLREPMESGEIHISRIQAQTTYPASFQLIAAMNPCPCGHAGSSQCKCTPDQISRYRGKISGPLLDRIDLQVTVPAIPQDQLTNTNNLAEPSSAIRKRVIAARDRQINRCGVANADLGSKLLDHYCALNKEQKELMSTAIQRFNLSARSYHRILRVARTIADLADRENIETSDLTEALSYRMN